MIEKKGTLQKVLLLVSFIFFLGYLILLFKVICLKYLSPADIIPHLERIGFRRPYNLIPFDTIKAYYIYDGMPMLRRIGNVFGNIALFVPIGLLLPLIFHRTKKIYKIILISFLLSLSMELFQYILGTGAADIDDVLLNTIGGLTGYIIYLLLKALLKNEVQIILGALILFLICLISGGWIAIKEFKLDLGITLGQDHDVEYMENIRPYDSTIIVPQRYSDVTGSLEGIKGDTLLINKFQIIREEKDNKATGQVMIIMSVPDKSRNPLFKYIVSENTYILRKDVDQYSSTQFDIQYSISRLDSIPIKCDLDIWLAHPDSTHADTLCYRITKIR